MIRNAIEAVQQRAFEITPVETDTVIAFQMAVPFIFALFDSYYISNSTMYQTVIK